MKRKALNAELGIEPV